ncbi:hypothetical protein FA13DRAFT_1714590 [Coprinellus micaceus]|uniref:Uncharacterized protein n=1 Tax=Coprinellus micaceus TaxID=71717 RepID=A0A4Y7SRT9_COPMI|nr:hypothetical protein FA13DRAFT_1714590 [Coprinellus micaceus]
MSSFANGFWIPSGIEFGARFLDTGLNFYDSLIGTLICTLFSGIQLCMVRRIFQLHFRLRESKNARSRRQAAKAMFLIGTSMLLTFMFLAASLIYCVQFSRNVLSLRSVAKFSDLASATDPPIYRGCARDSIGTCVEVSLDKLQQGRRMELAFAALVQALIFLTDILLLIRCYLLFIDKAWVWATALVSFVASIGVWIFGLASLSKAGGLSGGSSWNWASPSQASIPRVDVFLQSASVPPSGVDASLPRGYHTSMSILASLMVNAIVTVAIVTRVLIARRRLQDNLPLSQVGEGRRKDDVYSTAAALIIESASPPVVFGILAAVFSSPDVKASRKAFDFELIPKIAWVAFTALAPQLILVRILQGRAWGSEQTYSNSSGATASTLTRSSGRNTIATPMRFTLKEQLDADDYGKRRPSSYRSTSSSGEERKGDAIEIQVRKEAFDS